MANTGKCTVCGESFEMCNGPFACEANQKRAKAAKAASAAGPVATLHPDDVLFFNEVRTAMRRVARNYQLALRSVEPLPMPKTSMADRMGDCTGIGDIRLVMRCTVDGEWCDAPLSPAEVWETAAHELSHLRHMNHGHAFQEFLLELKTALTNQTKDHREKVIDRLVKMQAQRDDARSRAKNGEAFDAKEAEKEAEAFAAAINRMMIEHELNPSDLDYARANANDPVIEMRVDLQRYRIKTTRTRVAWQESLARIVAKNHLCTFLLRSGSNDIWFVGTTSHATVAEYVYGMLVPAAFKMSEQARRDFRNECRRKCNYTKMDGFPEAYGFREAWLDAFVCRISERLEEVRKQAVADAEKRHADLVAQGLADVIPGAESVALVRLSGALAKVTRYIDNKFKARKGASSLSARYRSNAAGREAGRAAADKMPIGCKVVSSAATRGLIG